MAVQSSTITPFRIELDPVGWIRDHQRGLDALLADALGDLAQKLWEIEDSCWRY
jgi:hypothetical protein